MKKIWKILIAAAALAAAVAATGCSQWDSVYKGLADDGYTVRVKYNANGGRFAGRIGASLTDVFNAGDYDADGDGKAEIKLIAPEDEARNTAGNYAASRDDGYFLAGWYRERTPRVNEKDEPLDDYGQLTSVSGREQGYSYSGRWDFDKDTLEVELSKVADLTGEEETVQLELYAAWVPYFNFEFYALDGDGEPEKLESVNTDKLLSITLPVWNQSTGKLDMGHVPTRENMTFVEAYADADKTEPLTGTLAGEYDPEHGVAVGHTIKVYTTWREGNWFKIYTADQLYKNSSPTGSYEICADLDFEGKIWSPTLAGSEYKGTILGGGHTIKNVTVNQGDNSKNNGGLFGMLGASATISDVKFENITYSIQAGSRIQDASFGVLAGTVSEDARLTNVSVSGTLELGKDCYPSETYNIGLLFGSGSYEGMSFADITFKLLDEDQNPATAVLDPDTGRVEVTYKKS